MYTKLAPLFLSASLFCLPMASFAQAGCCAGHGGVSHCDSKSKHKVCKDKTQSPSCKCDAKKDNKKASDKKASDKAKKNN